MRRRSSYQRTLWELQNCWEQKIDVVGLLKNNPEGMLEFCAQLIDNSARQCSNYSNVPLIIYHDNTHKLYMNNCDSCVVNFLGKILFSLDNRVVIAIPPLASDNLFKIVWYLLFLASRRNVKCCNIFIIKKKHSRKPKLNLQTS